MQPPPMAPNRSPGLQQHPIQPQQQQQHHHHLQQQQQKDDLHLPPLAHLPPYSHANPHPSATTLPFRTDIAASDDRDRRLPSLSTIMGDHAVRMDSAMDLDTRSNSVVSMASTEGALEGRSGSVTLDDPDVRLAAEALGDLRADFVSSPPNLNAVLPTSPAAVAHPGARSQSPQAPEPLLALLTTTHPLLATTIENATSAYGGAKNYSPRFKSSAEYVEGYLTPLANTVGSVGRVTGVEGGVRWFLGAGRRQRSDVEAGGGSGSKKRRKVEDGNVQGGKRFEAESFPRSSEAGNLQDSFPPTPKDSRRMSFASTVDTLPAYDEMRSPAYTETTTEPGQANPNTNAAWQSRLIMSTSGLSVAMSDESLRSLKYCLKWLRWANEHIGGVVGTLKVTLEQYEQPEKSNEAQGESEDVSGDIALAEAQPEKTSEETREELATRINTLKGDVLKTLRDAINMVSRYAGGALPENARVLVRRHLTSLPQRFRIATMTDGSAQQSQTAPGSSADRDSAVRESAQKVLVLAKEGLDMVSQVSGVLDGTIVSAEEWCERMGKKRRDSRELQNQPVLPQVEPNNDVKMG